MQRRNLESLRSWKVRPSRKPLIIRGARQVGKTTLVRLFAQSDFESLVEINFERDPAVAELFQPGDPKGILERLGVLLDQPIHPGKTLLFLDEIQAAPEVIASLRYFFEELPELHIIGAGSLLELALEQPTFSVPVGRIEYLHLGPMQFDEFLRAAGQDAKAEFLETFELGDTLPDALHRELLSWLRRFLVVGGMPEAVRAHVADGGYRESEIAKNSVLATFRDDFGKYGRQVDPGRIRKVFESLPRLIGRKLKYSHIDPGERSKDLASALHLLNLARVVHRVRHTSGNGVPLGAEAKDRLFKVIFLDVGLIATATGLSILDIEGSDEITLVQQGTLAEQFVGQHLLYSANHWEEPQLFYWAREKRNSSAEVDYLFSQGPHVIPVEVKAGKSGTLKSLHLFVQEKGRPFALRFSSAPPSLLETEVVLPNGVGASGTHTPLRLLSLPLYLVHQARRLVQSSL